MNGEYKHGGPAFPGLDNKTGPAKRISGIHAATMIASSLDAAGYLDKPPLHDFPVNRAGSPVFKTAVVAALLLLVSGGIATAGLVVARKLLSHAAQPKTAAVSPQKAVAKRTSAPVITTLPRPQIAMVDEPVQLEEPVRHHAKAKAQDLLARANLLRAQGKWRQAAAVYGNTALSFAGSEAAYAANMAMAALELGPLHDPRRALSIYRRVLQQQPFGALAPEARLGIADCYAKLNSPGAQRRALEEFLQAHPTNVSAPSAQRRLQSL